MRRKVLFGAACCLCLILIFFSYSNTFQSPPVLDDFHSFVRNPKIFVDHWSIQAFEGLSKTYFGLARWIPMVTFALDYRLGQGRLEQFHFTNLSIHLLAFLAVLFLVKQCADVVRKSESEFGNAHLALWVAALWALNPVQTNAVTYLVQRMASLQALFFVLSVAFYVRGRRQWDGRWCLSVVINHMGTLFFALCAFLSKENSAMLPVMIGCAELWLFQANGLKRLWTAWRRSHRLIRFITVALVLFGIIEMLFVIKSLLAGYHIRHFGPWERLLTEARIVVWYVGLLLFPFPFRLSMEHDVVVSRSLISPPTTVLSLVLIGLAFYSIIRYRRRFPIITFGVLWYFLNLAIESTIVPLELVFEHRLYLPSIGLVMALVFGVERILRRYRHQFTLAEWRKLAWSSVAIMCSCLALMTHYRNRDWRDIITFNRDAALKAPNHPRAHANYASALLKSGRYKEAVAEAERALALGMPGLEDYVVAANVIVGAAMQQDRWQDAVNKGRVFIEQRSPDSDAMALPFLYLRVAESYRRLGKMRAAYDHVKKALTVAARLPFFSPNVTAFAVQELNSILTAAGRKNLDIDGDGIRDPGDNPKQLWIAKVFLDQNLYDQAVQLLNMCVERGRLRRQAMVLLKEIAIIREKNRFQAVRWSFTRKYVREPFTPFKACMAVAYLVRKKRFSGPLMAVGQWCLERAEDLRPDEPDVHLLQGWYDYEQGRYDSAVKAARKAVSLDPRYAKAWLGLGFFLRMSGNVQEAIGAFEKTLQLYPDYRDKQVVLGLIAQLRHQLARSEHQKEGVISDDPKGIEIAALPVLR